MLEETRPNTEVSTPVTRIFRYGPELLLALAACFLLLFNLADRPLWTDEAESALLAQSIVEHGLPYVAVGNNIVKIARDIDANADGLWVWTPWLDEYLCTASFALFGTSTWAARFPFALIGLLCVWIIYRLGWRLWRNRAVALTAAFLLTSNLAFLLFARQCRYYAVVMAAQLVLTAGFAQLAQADNRRGTWLVALALVVQFYCNYMMLPGNLLALAAAMLHGRSGRLAWRRLIISGVLFTLAVLPWLAYAKPFGQAGSLGPDHAWTHLVFYSDRLHFHVVPLVLLLLPLAGHFLKRPITAPFENDVTRAAERFLLWCFPAHFFVLSFQGLNFFRYMLPLLPAAILLAAIWLVRVLPARRWLVLAVALLGLTNVVAVGTGAAVGVQRPLGSPLVEQIVSLTTPYASRQTRVTQFLRANTAPGDRVLCVDSALPLIFDTGLTVINASLTDGRLPSPAPDWILSESLTGVSPRRLDALPAALASQYERLSFDVPDSARLGAMPDPVMHEAFTAPKKRAFVLYRKKKNTEKSGGRN